MASFASATSPCTFVRAFPASPPRPGDVVVEVVEVAIAGQGESAPFAGATELQDAGADAGAEQALLVSVEHVDEDTDNEPGTPPVQIDEALLAEMALRASEAQDDAAQAPPAPPAAASPVGIVPGRWRKRKATTLLRTPWAPKKPFPHKPVYRSPLGGLRVLWESDDDEPARVASPVLGGKKIEWSDSDEE